MSEENKPLIVFLDSIGRTVIGLVSDEDELGITVENPAVVQVQLNNQNGQIQLQLLPLFFKEFLADSSVPTEWRFNRHSITICNGVELSPQFINQYAAITGRAVPPSKETEVIKLFDE